MIDIKHPNGKERTFFFVAVLLVSLISMLFLLQHYITTILIAGIFSIIIRPIFLLLRKRFKIGDNLASFLTIVLVLILIILPLYTISNHLIQEFTRISSDISVDRSTLVQTIKGSIVGINTVLAKIPLLDVHITSSNIDEALLNASKNVSTYLLNSAIKLGGASIEYIANLFIFLFLTFFLIPSLPALRMYVTQMSPLHDDIDNIYINRLVALTLSLMKSLFIIALAQGILGGIFLALAGFPYVLTFTIILMFASLIPYVGTNIVVLPIAGFMLLQGNVAGAVTILIGQIVFVSNIDNILAAAILSHDTQLHPALMLMSIIGGLSVFGLSGLLFGPMIVILFLTSLEIYMKHYRY